MFIVFSFFEFNLITAICVRLPESLTIRSVSLTHTHTVGQRSV